MRSFIALNFNNEVKAQIKDVINKVKSNSIQGKFVSEEHMHLTVEFLGEIKTDRVGLTKDIMDNLEFEAFTLRLTKVGYFKRREGDIYWLGIEKNDTLFNIHEKLYQSLIINGFELEDRKYKPHLTIGRKVELDNYFTLDEINDVVSQITIDINKVDLMKSEFINGKLIHSVLYSRQLF
ncbi:MAG: RNA 2',3'-cyclic phosphodiesterase [Eubacteriales bacterium]|nr:RNA 2',3'-cyclic phosphodiesterase [Eubacteriales bacterium]MDD3198734.1 RNA 2',3'-cyclic phosphodiesterase [Eubacteriales bacterium]MDD4121569.1 RNA 2',3'-cyclic phosphodiesterase [Eubacteriales bacterium]MDD4629020.1 RNA 2',3'-cyclic phosphodiesterase [Eubacteriales bacterium]